VTGTCDVTGDYDTLVIRDYDSLPQASQQVTSDIVTPDVTHDCDLWDGEHHVTSLSGHFGYLENDAKVLASFVLRIVRFIQKHPIGSRPVEQFPSILGAGSIMWHLFQTVFAAGWDHFKVSPQPNSPLLVEAIRTLYGPNLPQEPSPDTEMAVDQPAVEEAPFTTVTNKKSKGKGKVPLSTNPSAPFQNVPTPALMVSRAPPLPLPAKMAIVKPTPTKVATKPQAPKQAPKSFAQAARSGNPQSTPRFAPASAHPEYESLLCLRDMFPDLPMEKVLAMHQSGFGASASPNRGGAVHSGASRAPKMTTHGPTRRQVLIPLDTPTAEVVVANAATAVESCNRGLVEAHSKLRVELVRKAWDGISMSTNFVASAAELEVIKQWLKKVAGLAASTVVEPRLPQSKSFLKILGVPYWGNNSSLSITQA